MNPETKRKGKAGTLGGAVAVLAAFVAGLFGVDVPAGVEAAVATAVAGVTALVKR